MRHLNYGLIVKELKEIISRHRKLEGFQ